MSKDSSSSGDQPPRRPLIRLALLILGGILIVIVVLQNTETVETHILFATVEMPRAVLLFSTFALGFILGIIVCFLRRRPRK